eukprot:TRINITY_DN13706_c0_g1_i1.p1 TRINITY_DN13706_c0_g1~~TRINITY_DN13706_c0_g1_i1.p1  ORF type:complete len:190 (+),score=48.32 TRINITY_DN13706_c0_g1_i1:51-572(+)
MKAAGFAPNVVTFSRRLNHDILCNSGSGSGAILRELKQRGLATNDQKFSTLAFGIKQASGTDTQLSATQLALLEEVYRTLRTEHGMPASLHGLNVRLDAHANARDRAGVERVWAEMKREEIAPEVEQFTTRLKIAASQAEADAMLAEMRAAGVAESAVTKMVLQGLQLRWAAG